MTPTIRAARTDDIDVIVDFNSRLARESELLDLDRNLLRRGVAAALADDNKIRYFLAEVDGKIVGQTGLTWEWSDWRNGWFWWVQSVYVVPEARRLGAFRALWQHLVADARRQGNVIGIRLYMDRDNTVARQTYRSMGLVETDYVVLEDTWTNFR